MSMTVTTAAPAKASSRRKARVITVAAAVVAAVVIWGVADLAGMHIKQPAFSSSPATSLNAGFVIGISLIVSLAAWGLLAALERATARARTAWTAVAAVVLLISLGGPFGGHGVSIGNRLVLALIHIVVGAILIGWLPRAGDANR